MGAPLPRPAALNAQAETPIKEWPYLDADTLLKTRSCLGWSDDQVRQKDWAPEAA